MRRAPGAWTAIEACEPAGASASILRGDAERDMCAGFGGGIPMTFQRERSDFPSSGEPGVGRTRRGISSEPNAPTNFGISGESARAITLRMPPPTPAPWSGARFLAFWRTRPL